MPEEIGKLKNRGAKRWRGLGEDSVKRVLPTLYNSRGDDPYKQGLDEGMSGNSPSWELAVWGAGPGQDSRRRGLFSRAEMQEGSKT